MLPRLVAGRQSLSISRCIYHGHKQRVRSFIQARSIRLPAVTPPVSTQLPSDSFQLLSSSEKTGPAEDALYETQIEDVKSWWNSARYEGIKRPYSAEDIVSKRGALQQTYSSSLMARKLFELLKEKARVQQPVHTCELLIGNLSG